MADNRWTIGRLPVSAALPALALAIAPSALAQQPVPAVSQAVVQPVPGRDGLSLNAALARLARNPRDGEALIDAGRAALAMGDVDAAIGFYRRADEVLPGNPRVKAGLAGALVRNENPFDAITLFAEAERGGLADAAVAADRGLAYDLVGDNETAQRHYRLALARESSDEVVRRLALSLAIAGDRKSAETTLAPLVARQDKAALRTRAFALAILGQTDDAVGIAYASLPQDLAAAISPYLRYMPRLTPAQQAAAANFGQFPRASEMGQDDPRVARFATNTRRAALATADAALIPRGEPLGQRASAPESREARRERQAREQQAAREQREARERAERQAREQREAQRRAEQQRQRQLAEAEAAARRRGTTASATPAGQPVRPLLTSAGVATPLPQASASLPAAIAQSAPPQAPLAVAANVPPPAIPATARSAAPVPVPGPAPTLPPPTPPPVPTRVAAGPPPGPGIVLPLRPAASPAAQSPAPAPVPVAAPVAAPVPARIPAQPPASPAARPRVADAFGDISVPVADSRPASGAVDIRRIRPARIETGPGGARPATAKPAQPLHPSRIWVQVATGRDRNALGFDWRRMIRANAALFRGKKPYLSAWGQSTRLLTGPFESEAAAEAFINQLRRADINSFVWTSPAGQVVDAISPK